jgi:colicin import membrane protein
MARRENSYNLPIILAIILHAAILGFLLFKFVPHQKLLSVQQAANIVQATVVTQPEISQPAPEPPAPKVIPETKPAIKPVVEKPKKPTVTKPTAEQRKIMQQNLQQQISAEKHQLAKQFQTQAAQSEIDKYKAMILQTISSYWLVPENLEKGIYCQLLVHVGPGGVVLSVDLTKSSGNYLLDRSAKTAVLKASPLPVPTDPTLFDNFREIKLTVRPEGIM